MLVGQIYYYNKILDTLPVELNEQSLTKIELMGVDKLKPADFQGLDSFEIKTKLRSIFQTGYLNILENSNHPRIADFWYQLTSPLLDENHQNNEQKIPNYNNTYFGKIKQWASSGYPQSLFIDIIKEGELENSEENLLLFYGLKVLYKFSNQNLPKFATNFQTKPTTDQETDIEMSSNPEILVICNQVFAPLFVNLNCQFLDLIEDEKLQISQIQKILSVKNDIKLILISGANAQSLVNTCTKTLPNLLVSAIDLSLNVTSQIKDNNTFFDQIVKKTLGVRLN